MKILQLIQKKQYRGAEIFACQLSNQFLELGHEVKVITIYDGNAILPFNGDIISLNRNVSWRYVDFSGWQMLANIVKEFKPDIIQANAADTLKYTIFSKMVHGWEVPIIFRNASASSYYIKDALSKSINNFLLKRTDLILSVSQSSKKDLNNIFPFTKNYSKVLPVGVDEQNLLNKVRKEPFTGRKIFHIGSFTEEKNHIHIITLFEKIKQIKKEAELHLMGEGPLLPLIKEIVKKKNLGECVFFYGGIKFPYSSLQKADVLILPSLVEGLPAVILEAMFMKIPVVAYNVGGINEILNENTGFLVQANNCDLFVENVIKTLIKPDEVKLTNAYNLVKKNYGNKNIAHNFLNSYRELLFTNSPISQE